MIFGLPFFNNDTTGEELRFWKEKYFNLLDKSNEIGDNRKDVLFTEKLLSLVDQTAVIDTRTDALINMEERVYQKEIGMLYGGKMEVVITFDGKS